MSDKIERLHEISQAIVDGNREQLTMRIPAEPDRDADLVVSWAADEITRLRAEVERLNQAAQDYDLARDIRTSQAVGILQGKIESLNDEVKQLKLSREKIIEQAAYIAFRASTDLTPKQACNAILALKEGER